MFVCLPPLLFLRLWLRFKWLRLWRRPWRLGHGIRIANDALQRPPFSEFPATVPSNYWSQQLTAQHCFTVSWASGLGLFTLTSMHLAKTDWLPQQQIHHQKQSDHNSYQASIKWKADVTNLPNLGLRSSRRLACTKS